MDIAKSEKENKNYIWYQDLQWDKNLEGSGRIMQLHLSDEKRTTFRVDNIEVLKNLIQKLEASL